MKNILSNENFISALVMVFAFIILGFTLRKLKIFKDDGQKFLSKFLLIVLIPCLAFSAFMCDFSIDDFKQNISIFIFSFVLMILFFAIIQFIFRFFDKDNYKMFSTLIVLGQMTLFTIPILKSVYPDNNDVLIACNMITLTFRLFLYIYAYLVISKTKINKDNIKLSLKNIFLNPTMIAMFLGLLIYLTQNFMFKVNVDDKMYSIFRIDKTLPVVFNVISTLEKMTTPLAMMLVGMTLGKENVKKAFVNKKAYIFSILRVIVIPLFTLLLVLFTNAIHLTSFNQIQTIVMVLCFAAPLSAVVNTYCISFDNQAYLASDVCFLSTILAIISMPLFYILIVNLI